MLFKILLFLYILITSGQAMLSDGIHLPKDYIQFAESQEAFKAACFVYDHHRHILQTGVLISPDIVMTAAHGFEGIHDSEGHLHLKGVIVGFGNTVTHQSPQNYRVKALRTHPHYYRTEFPLQAKYDIVFLKLEKPVEGIQPVPLFEEKILNNMPPLYVATFGSADLPLGASVQRRAFCLPEADDFAISGKDPETFHNFKTVMMGAIFFDPKNDLIPPKAHAPEIKLRTYAANKRWNQLKKPPYALTLPGSSGAPVFMTLMENGSSKTYVFGIIQSFSHLAASSFRHRSGEEETHRLLTKRRQKIYGHYQSVFCIPYKLHEPLENYQNPIKIYRISRHIKKILNELKTKGK